MPDFGIDCSNYGGVPSASQVADLVAGGVRFAIVGTQNEAIASAQVAAFQGGGIRCELYLYPMYDAADAARIASTIGIGKRFGLGRIWDDVEWNEELHGPRPPVPVVIAGIGDRLRAYRGAGFEAGIYSSETQWPLMTGGRLDGIIKQIDTPLWSAYYYNDRRVPSFADFRRFGPWNECLAWQYHDTTNDLAGFSVDLNIWNPNATVVPAPRGADVPAPEDGLSDDEREELGERRALSSLMQALLTRYRCQPRPGGKVELVGNDEAPQNPRIIIAI